jgi:hypothetical protein
VVVPVLFARAEQRHLAGEVDVARPVPNGDIDIAATIV